ncbi:hypothetical protein V6N13_099379 [Hibiscus sabdariffa]
MSNWNMEVFGHIVLKKKKLLARLRGIDKALQSRYNEYLIDLDRTLRCELEEVMQQEELLWFQKSRSKWVSYEDQNTRFSMHRLLSVARSIQLFDCNWMMGVVYGS